MPRTKFIQAKPERAFDKPYSKTKGIKLGDDDMTKSDKLTLMPNFKDKTGVKVEGDDSVDELKPTSKSKSTSQTRTATKITNQKAATGKKIKSATKASAPKNKPSSATSVTPNNHHKREDAMNVDGQEQGGETQPMLGKNRKGGELLNVEKGEKVEGKEHKHWSNEEYIQLWEHIGKYGKVKLEEAVQGRTKNQSYQAFIRLDVWAKKMLEQKGIAK